MADTDMENLPPETKKAKIDEYAATLKTVWKELIEQGPESGDPLVYFEKAMQLTEERMNPGEPS